MERNKNIDIVRAGSILLIILYHIIAIMGAGGAVINLPVIKNVISYGGEVGVTLFFILSGLGIAHSIHYREVSGKPYKWTEFMKRRCARIVPQYYFCVLSLVVFTDCAGFLSREGIFQIVSHLGFFHNLTISSSGSINGALWTMGTIMRFYLLALPLYKLIYKKPLLSVCGAVAVTVLSKIVVYTMLDANGMRDTWYYFTYGRELITSLDNFAIGMAVGILLLSKKEDGGEKNSGNLRQWVGILFDVVVVYGFIYISGIRNIWANTRTAYVWHSCLALVLGHFIWNVANLKLGLKSKISSVLLWISKYQYGIYLWHIVIIYNLYENSGWMQQIAQKSYIAASAIILFLSCAAGYVSTEGIENGIMKKVVSKK